MFDIPFYCPTCKQQTHAMADPVGLLFGGVLTSTLSRAKTATRNTMPCSRLAQLPTTWNSKAKLKGRTMPVSNLALILDTETTGNKPDSELIEIGMVMLDVPSLVELGEFTIVIEPSPEQFSTMMANPIVSEMHKVNGLVDDLIAKKGVAPKVADSLINKWLDQFTQERTHIPYGGSGVAHFDRQYINRQLPRLGWRITYWALDVGSVRRIFALQGAATASIEAKTHRALDDAKVHAEELRYYAQAGQYADNYRDILNGK